VFFLVERVGGLSDRGIGVTVGSVTSGGVLSAILAAQPDEVLLDLKRQHEKRIADARGTIAQSEAELRLIVEALAARGHHESPAPGGSSSTAVERDREVDGRFQGIPRARILDVASTLSSPITPARVVEAFTERGETVNVEQIRIALNRLAKDGHLTKVGPSRFDVPATLSTDPDPAPEQHAPASPSDVVRPYRQGVLGSSLSDTFERSP
jgi:hypothetical protein